ncbi:hypothetical protein A0H81_05789 [Grifola frondosa]|uniref:Uncharacterized protein n=1 Tax=Grifola frondosa TaxID=5627 RepID=A0A1C7MC56_GRIFR|nr:hypothetical protein A0H81_05789 [Grifola frondosa]
MPEQVKRGVIQLEREERCKEGEEREVVARAGRCLRNWGPSERRNTSRVRGVHEHDCARVGPLLSFRGADGGAAGLVGNRQAYLNVDIEVARGRRCAGSLVGIRRRGGWCWRWKASEA